MKLTAALLLCSPLLFLPVSAFAESTFTAAGEGHAVAKPDIAFVDIGFNSKGDTPEAAAAADAATVGEVTAALGKAGVEPRDIQTATYVIEQQMGPQGCGQTYADQAFVPCVPEGFEIRNSLTIRIRDLANYGKILGAAIDAGLSDISRITLAVSDPQPLRDEAYTNALLAAKAKAELTAKTLGFELGPIIDVGANYRNSYDENPPATLRDGQDDGYYGEEAADIGVFVGLQPGELTFTQDASITYQIIQKR
ncbi:MAG: DUF541 domain-containing protein [Hyphomicrobiales bacterium]|nr:MAG: DUF541 domain-containing protein [Hyphomicrobiales bacterium]